MTSNYNLSHVVRHNKCLKKKKYTFIKHCKKKIVFFFYFSLTSSSFYSIFNNLLGCFRRSVHFSHSCYVYPARFFTQQIPFAHSCLRDFFRFVKHLKYVLGSDWSMVGLLSNWLTCRF